MSLTAKQPYKYEKTVDYEVVLRPATLKKLKTGNKIIKTTIDANGERVETQEDETTDIFEAAKKEIRQKKIEVWIVETWHNEKCEKHEFMSEIDAKTFFGGFKQ